MWTDLSHYLLIDSTSWIGNCVLSKSTNNRITLWAPDSNRYKVRCWKSTIWILKILFFISIIYGKCHDYYFYPFFFFYLLLLCTDCFFSIFHINHFYRFYFLLDLNFSFRFCWYVISFYYHFLYYLFDRVQYWYYKNIQ